MAEAATKLPVKAEAKETTPATPGGWQVLENLRREIDHLFDEFPPVTWRSPFSRPFGLERFRRGAWNLGVLPAIDIAEKDNAYEISAELPGLDEKNIEVNVSGGMLTIKGEKEEAEEQKRKNYHLSERRYGSFQRSFSVPSGIDADKIEANFKKGVLTVSLPKSAEAQKKEKKIAVTAQ